MANVGVMDGKGVSVGNGVFVGESVGVEVGVSEGETSMVCGAVVDAAGSKVFAGAQETNIHVKQIPIITRLSMADFYCPLSAASIVC